MSHRRVDPSRPFPLTPLASRCMSALGVALLAAGCGSDQTTLGAAAPAPNAGDDPAPVVEAPPAAGPVYALVTLTWSEDGPTGYVVLSDTLDVGDVSLDRAREFAGYASVGVVDGQLFVSPSADDPTLERYEITSTLDWTPTGTLSFVNEGVQEVGFYRQYMGRGGLAYLDVEVSGRVLWDPADFAIRGVRSDTVLPLQRDGLDLFANMNRTHFIFEGNILRPFSYHDQDWFRWSADTQILVYDAETQEPVQRIEAPCPGLDSITRDEAGNTYLGTWEYSALSPLMGIGAAPCAVRLRPDNTLDPSWNGDLTALTGGRQVVNFRYVGGGRAIAAVLRAERYGEGFDFTRLVENVDDFWAGAARYHELWMIDVEAGTAAPVAGIDELEFINPNFSHAVIDGRVFVFLSPDNSNNPDHTVTYELFPDGRAVRAFEAPGTATQWVRVR